MQVYEPTKWLFRGTGTIFNQFCHGFQMSKLEGFLAGQSHPGLTVQYFNQLLSIPNATK